MVDLAALLDDLDAEYSSLDRLVAGLGAEQWILPTPIPEWSIADQIGHLAVSEAWAARAISDPDGFQAARGQFSPSIPPDDGPAALTAWRAARARTIDAARVAGGNPRVPWFGPPMSLASLLTARLMETWAHGVDIADTLRTRITSHGLRHIADLGVRTRGFSSQLRGLAADDTPIRVELTDGDHRLTWGPSDAVESITGPVDDFCLVVTRRRAVAETELGIDGPAAERWMEIAQVFLDGRP